MRVRNRWPAILLSVGLLAACGEDEPAPARGGDRAKIEALKAKGAAIAAAARRPTEDLVKDLGSGNDALRKQAADALRDAGASARAAVPALVASLRGAGDEARLSIARALGSIGPAALPALEDALGDADADVGVRRGALEAVKEIGASAAGAAPSVEALLKDGDADVRRAATEALEALRGRAR